MRVVGVVQEPGRPDETKPIGSYKLVYYSIISKRSPCAPRRRLAATHAVLTSHCIDRACLALADLWCGRRLSFPLAIF